MPRRTTSGLLCALMLMLTLAACSDATHVSATPVPQTVVTQTAEAQARAIRALAPVTVIVSADVRGSLAADDVVVTVMIALTNHTNAPIHLAGTCSSPALLVTIWDQSGLAIYWTDSGAFCPLLNVTDVLTPIAAGGSLQTTEVAHLPQEAMTTLRPGSYLVQAKVTLWHQGTLDQVMVDPGIARGSTVAWDHSFEGLLNEAEPTIRGGTATSDPVIITLS